METTTRLMVAWLLTTTCAVADTIKPTCTEIAGVRNCTVEHPTVERPTIIRPQAPERSAPSVQELPPPELPRSYLPPPPRLFMFRAGPFRIIVRVRP